MVIGNCQYQLNIANVKIERVDNYKYFATSGIDQIKEFKTRFSFNKLKMFLSCRDILLMLRFKDASVLRILYAPVWHGH